MKTDTLTETQRIELSTAEGFLSLFNAKAGSNFEAVHVAGPDEVPDVIASDSSGRILGIEVTLTEDRPRDIAAILGRSNHKSIDALKAHLRAVSEGKAQMEVNCLQGNVIEILRERIAKKLIKRYGANVALVIRETSISWDWELILPALRDYLDGQKVPFDQGIWLLSLYKDRLTHVYGDID